METLCPLALKIEIFVPGGRGHGHGLWSPSCPPPLALITGTSEPVGLRNVASTEPASRGPGVSGPDSPL